jgi:hypothetical protein
VRGARYKVGTWSLDVSRALNCVLFEQDCDQGGGGNCNQGAGDSSDGGADKERDEDREAHQVDARAHDAGDQEAVLDVDVDGVEDEDSGHLCPGVEGSYSSAEGNGEHCSGDRDDVKEAHHYAEQDEVADVEQAVDDDAAGSQGEHQDALAKEPFVHLEIGPAQSEVEAMALIHAEEREEEAVRVLAVQHEVDAEECAGEDVDEVGEPGGQRGEEIPGSGGESALGALGEGFKADAIGHGDLLQTGDNDGDALGEVVRELAEVAENGGKSKGEEEGEGKDDADEEDEDCDGAGGRSASDAEGGDAVDNRHQDDGEEGADVEDEKLMAELPGQGNQEKGDKGEDDVAADVGATGGAGLLRLPGGIRRGASRPDRVGLGGGQRLLLSCCSGLLRRVLSAAEVVLIKRATDSVMRAKSLASAWSDLINCCEQVVYGLLGSEGGGVDGDAG